MDIPGNASPTGIGGHLPLSWLCAVGWSGGAHEGERAAYLASRKDSLPLFDLGRLPPARQSYRAVHCGQVDSSESELRRIAQGQKPRQAEKWLARALYNSYREHPGGDHDPWSVLEDYEVPLKAPGSSNDLVGALDLLGRTGAGLPVLCELKVTRQEKLLKALIELYVYARILRLNEQTMVRDFSFQDGGRWRACVLGPAGFFDGRRQHVHRLGEDLFASLDVELVYAEFPALRKGVPDGLLTFRRMDDRVFPAFAAGTPPTIVVVQHPANGS